MLLSTVRLGNCGRFSAKQTCFTGICYRRAVASATYLVGARIISRSITSHTNHVCFTMHKQNPEDYEIANQLGLTENKPPAKATKRKKHGAAALRKAPQAPKRFKSSYIMFFTAKRDEVKAELGGTPTVCSGKHVLVFTCLFGGSYLCSCFLILVGGGSLKTNGRKVAKYISGRTCSLGSSSCQR